MTSTARPAPVVLASVIALVTTALVYTSRASDVQSCVDDNGRAYDLRAKGAWVAARDAFARCALASCPAAVASDCAAQRDEAGAHVASVVVRAASETGEVLSARLRIDGALVSSERMAGEIELDPGAHDLLFSVDGWPDVTIRRTLADGARRVEVVAVFRRPPAEPVPAIGPALSATEDPQVEAETRPTLSTSAVVVGAVGVASMGAFAYLGITGARRANELHAMPAGTVSSDDASAVKTRLRWADVCLGVGVVALTAAVVIQLAHRDDPSSAMVLSAGPLAGGAAAFWSGEF